MFAIIPANRIVQIVDVPVPVPALAIAQNLEVGRTLQGCREGRLPVHSSHYSHKKSVSEAMAMAQKLPI
jgi:hypothetical protein